MRTRIGSELPLAATAKNLAGLDPEKAAKLAIARRAKTGALLAMCD